MIIFPAVDIQDGKAVRLRRGVRTESSVFSDDPLEMARKWRDAGATWLHVIDLDGAFEGVCVNAPLIGRISSELDLPIQVGGGIRSLESARQYIDAGIARLIIGTMALENPAEFSRLCAAFPGRIGVSLDAESGKLKSRGWVQKSGQTAEDVLPALEKAGASFIIYTDIERDGMRSGVNMEALKKILDLTNLPVIAAGGVSSNEDIRALTALPDKNFEGVITGRAICEGTLDLAKALEIAQSVQNVN